MNVTYTIINKKIISFLGTFFVSNKEALFNSLLILLFAIYLVCHLAPEFLSAGILLHSIMAKHNLPIIARNIPVFREVAGKNAYYFSGKKPQDIERALISWMKLYNKQQNSISNDLPYLSWKQSAELLVKKLGL